MSTQIPAPPVQPPVPAPGAPPAAPPAPPTPTPAPPSEPPAQEIDWVAEARKWEARAKENKTAADELAALKAAQMTESEKAAARLAELETTVKGYQTKEQIAAWKGQVSTETGVPAAALAGSTLEEIQAHAETLKALIGSTAPPAPPAGPTVPGEGGAPPQAVAQLSETDLKSLTPKQINQARREGRLNKLMGL